MKALAVTKLKKYISEIPTSSTRYELRHFARSEFERNKDVTDIVSLNYPWAAWMRANAKWADAMSVDAYKIPYICMYGISSCDGGLAADLCRLAKRSLIR